MKNVKKVIEKLNQPTIIDEEEFESEFDFHFDTKSMTIIDYNEQYTYHYVDDINCMMYDASLEFGFNFEPKDTDYIMDELLEAVKRDFGEDAFIEWQDVCTMVIVK